MIVEGVCEHCGNANQDTEHCAIEGCPHKRTEQSPALFPQPSPTGDTRQ